MAAALIILLQFATAPAFDLATVPRPGQATSETGPAGEAEVVVRARDPNRHRLPLPIERDPDARRDGEPASAVAAITPTGRCGIFAGERRCGKAEAARHGYGDGRDPATFLGKLTTAVLNPD